VNYVLRVLGLLIHSISTHTLIYSKWNLSLLVYCGY
jgi:hypothetical protein